MRQKRLRITTVIERAPSPADAAADALERSGREVVRLERMHGSARDVERLALRMQPALLRMTQEALEAERLPLPEYLVMGYALERAILEGARRTRPTSFATEFRSELRVAVEYAKLTGMYVDRWILKERGMPTDEQALLAAAVEHICKLPAADRAAPYYYFRYGMAAAEIAAMLQMPELDVKRKIVSVLSAARGGRDAWLRRWSAEDAEHGARGEAHT